MALVEIPAGQIAALDPPASRVLQVVGKVFQKLHGRGVLAAAAPPPQPFVDQALITFKLVGNLGDGGIDVAPALAQEHPGDGERPDVVLDLPWHPAHRPIAAFPQQPVEAPVVVVDAKQAAVALVKGAFAPLGEVAVGPGVADDLAAPAFLAGGHQRFAQAGLAVTA